jgi:hypothetical protein
MNWITLIHQTAVVIHCAIGAVAKENHDATWMPV